MHDHDENHDNFHHRNWIVVLVMIIVKCQTPNDDDNGDGNWNEILWKHIDYEYTSACTKMKTMINKNITILI